MHDYNVKKISTYFLSFSTTPISAFRLYYWRLLFGDFLGLNFKTKMYFSLKPNCHFLIYCWGFFAKTSPVNQQSCDIILHALVKLGTWVTVGISPGWGWVGQSLEGLEGEGGFFHSKSANTTQSCHIERQNSRLIFILCHIFVVFSPKNAQKYSCYKAAHQNKF